MREVVRILGVVIASLTISPPVSAQTDKKYVQDVVDAGNRTIAFLLDKFRPVFPADGRDLLNPSRVLVIPAADFNAFANYQKREVLIPAQLVAEALLQIEGFILVQKRPSYASEYPKWVMYLQERYNKARQAAKTPGAKDNVPIRPFWAYVGLSQPLPLTEADEEFRQRAMSDALALVLAHELGHLVLKHKPYSRDLPAKESWKQEEQADAFAADLVKRSGFSVIPGLALFYTRFTSLEANEKGMPTGSHPPAQCRFYRIGSPEISEMLRDPDARRRFESSSTMKVTDLRAVFDRLRNECD